MWSIYYDLFNVATCEGMAPQDLGNGKFSNATLPTEMDMPGIYVIWNAKSKNRYIGISKNIRERFKGRLEVMVEMGFDQKDLSDMCIFWGNVYVWNDESEILRVTQEFFNGTKNIRINEERPCLKCSNIYCKYLQRHTLPSDRPFLLDWCRPIPPQYKIAKVDKMSMKASLRDLPTGADLMGNKLMGATQMSDNRMFDDEVSDINEGMFKGFINTNESQSMNELDLVNKAHSKDGEVDLERLLICYFARKFMDGGTVSNNKKIINPYKNETGNDVMVYVLWNGKYTIGDKNSTEKFGFDAATWNVNEAW